MILVKKSPFVFLKYVLVVELLFGLTPILVAELAGLDERYTATAAAGFLPYSLLLTLVVVTLQVLIIGICFAVWYFATYRIDEQAITYERGVLFGARKLADTQSIAVVAVKQGPLATRLNYGSLGLTLNGETGKVFVRNVSAPEQVAEFIQGLIDPHRPGQEQPPERAPSEIIALGEGQFVEFKASLVWDYRQQKPNKALYEPVMKNLVAFMNSSGGVLVIGVDDDGGILGLDPDYQTMKKPNSDGFENVFNMAFNSMIGVEFRRFVQVDFPQVEGKEICVVRVQRAPEPAYLSHQGTEKFYIRTGNSSQALSVSKATRYIQSHFRSSSTALDY